MLPGQRFFWKDTPVYNVAVDVVNSETTLEQDAAELNEDYQRIGLAESDTLKLGWKMGLRLDESQGETPPKIQTVA